MTLLTTITPEEFKTIFDESVKVMLGAIAATIGAYTQSKLSQKNTRVQLRIEKFERIYSLCQAVYDGHRDEILNAKKHLVNNPTKYTGNRKHPGVAMSELKMLVAAYAPDLKHEMEKSAEAHSDLKKAFIAFDENVLNKKLITQIDADRELAKCDDYLINLGNSFNVLKSKTASLLSSIVTK